MPLISSFGSRISDLGSGASALRGDVAKTVSDLLDLLQEESELVLISHLLND